MQKSTAALLSRTATAVTNCVYCGLWAIARVFRIMHGSARLGEISDSLGAQETAATDAMLVWKRRFLTPEKVKKNVWQGKRVKLSVWLVHGLKSLFEKRGRS